MSLRPPVVIAFSNDKGAAGWHRIRGPMGALDAAGLIRGRVEQKMWSAETLQVYAPDVVVLHGPVDDETIAMLRAAVPKAFIVMETDRVENMKGLDAFSVPRLPYVSDSLSDEIDFREIPTLISAATTETRSDEVHNFDDSVPLRVGIYEQPDDREFITRIRNNLRTDKSSRKIGIVALQGPSASMPPQMHVDYLVSQNLDIVVLTKAEPEEALLEVSAAGIAVIVEKCPKWMSFNATVSMYRDDGLLNALYVFANQPSKEIRRFGAGMRAWVKKNFTYEARMADRLAAWMPSDVKAWKPKKVEKSTVSALCIPDNGQPFLDACENAIKTGTNVCWYRPYSAMTNVSALQAAMTFEDKTATVVPLSSDGSNAFPRRDMFVPADLQTAGTITEKAAFMAGTRLRVRFPHGPVIMLSGSALAELGLPDVDAWDGDEERAIVEWSLRASEKGWSHFQCPDVYASAMVGPQPSTQANSLRLGLRCNRALALQDTSEPLDHDRREALEIAVLSSAWKGLMPGANGVPKDYATWRALQGFQTMAKQESTDKIRRLTNAIEGWDIFWNPMTTSRMTIQGGNFVDPFVDAIGSNPDAVIVYADHEDVMHDGNRYHCFKPDFDLELFKATDYVTQIVAVRSGIVPESVTNMTGLYRHLLKTAVLQSALGNDPRKIFVHVPKIMASVQVPSAEKLQQDATVRALIVREETRENAYVHPILGRAGCVMSQPNTLPKRTISVLLATNDDTHDQEFMDSLEATTGDVDIIEIIKVPYGANYDQVMKTVLGEFILRVDHGIRFVQPHWLSLLMTRADDVVNTWVAPRIVGEDGNILSAGIEMPDDGAVLAHVMRGAPSNEPGHLGLAVLPHEAEAVDPVCAVITTAYSRNQHRPIVDASVTVMLTSAPDPDRGILPERASDSKSGWNPNLAVRSASNGALVGEKMDEIAWVPPAGWGTGQRVLVINNRIAQTEEGTVESPAYAHAARGDVVLSADLSGITLTLVAPSLANGGRWHVTDQVKLNGAMKSLGIGKIVIASMVGLDGPAASAEVKRWLSHCHLPLEWHPNIACDQEMYCGSNSDHLWSEFFNRHLKARDAAD